MVAGAPPPPPLMKRFKDEIGFKLLKKNIEFFFYFYFFKKTVCKNIKIGDIF
jgi:hypothetical protein